MEIKWIEASNHLGKYLVERQFISCLSLVGYLAKETKLVGQVSPPATLVKVVPLALTAPVLDMGNVDSHKTPMVVASLVAPMFVTSTPPT